MNYARHNFILEQATKPEECRTNLELAQFHYFNPNGLHARKKVSDGRITQAVDLGLCKSGAILAYGSMNDYYVKKLSDLACDRTRVRRFEILSAIEGITKAIEASGTFLNALPSKKAQVDLISGGYDDQRGSLGL
ncbi:hypothetical protein [Eoetvoesiella caeni]|uniref:Uncharacterized protein n=1 Tax=Eoetvoesiella caeni TaxID=645616 RepID=A0A366GZS9_9BURK|nr:hypothetical protein [Eoetvoesiella caeni]MCI2811308.1 hypothetical protein [Eoetvoesiella caeni]NYT57193.1 hypothetical protein [Eoetvoesiella caeni]RBP33633.1 hypothetical protein DFR37_12624 [Eoetvoesiella caeni]